MEYNQELTFQRVIDFLHTKVWWGHQIKSLEYTHPTRQSFETPIRHMVMGGEKGFDEAFIAINSIMLALKPSQTAGGEDSEFTKDFFDLVSHIVFCVFPEEAQQWPGYEDTHYDCWQNGGLIILFNEDKVWAETRFSDAIWGEFEMKEYFPDIDLYRDLVRPD